MATADFIETRVQKIGLFVFVIINSFCADELVPKWSFFKNTLGLNLGLSHAALYGIAMAGGALGGAMIARRYFLAGIVGGVLGSAGALMSVAAYLSAVDVSHSAVMAIVAIAGALPGILLGIGLGMLQKRFSAR